MKMRKRLLFCTLAALSSQAMAAAYKIPENSINSTALAGAYVANAHGADASYFNPAAMAFNEGGAMLEGNLTFIQLSPIDYTGATGLTDSTKTENFVLPAFHYVSPAVGNARFGLSLVVPAGLSKRWKDVGRAFAQEFTLETIEINPNMGYKINDRFSIGGGVRAVYTKGRVESTPNLSIGVPVGRTMKGDSWDFGYNLAVQFKATDELDLAATYRSKVDLNVEGYANLYSVAAPIYTGDASVSVPIPATLALAAAYTFAEKTTVEFTYERNYWSAYDYLDFDYSSPQLPVFDDPIPKNWDDTNTYRIGVTHQLNPKWTLMAGFAYDESPAPKETIGFELPDSTAKIYSIGARYKHSDALSFGGAFLYDKKDTLRLEPGVNTANGLLAAGAEFEDARAYLLTVGLEYKF